MKFKATREQIVKVAQLAYGAAVPMGMGHLHYTSAPLPAEAVEITNHGLDMDYVQGRMVKLSVWPAAGEEGVWEVPDHEPRVDYQSWATVYPTYPALLKAAGIAVAGKTPVITKCSIGPMPNGITDPMPKVHVTFDDGTDKDLFEYYPDEISFSEREFIGLTETAAYDLRHKKDVAYLRS